MDFETLEHTADTGFRVRGATREELFANAAMALAEIVMDRTFAQPRESHRLTYAGSDVEERLVNWLNEVLWLMDGLRIAPAAIKDGEVWGEPRDDEKHPPRVVVKAVTFHQLVVTQENGGWMAEVFLDI